LNAGERPQTTIIPLANLFVDSYLRPMNLTAVYEPAKEGGYVAWLEEMPGVQTQGETLSEAKENLRDALQISLEYLREKARAIETADSVRENFDLAVS
jgi:predicted RNase H-like HicB family nuclease